MKKSILFLATAAMIILIGCKKDLPEPIERNWYAHVRYESTIKKEPVYLTFESGSVSFEKYIPSRPTNAMYVWDTLIILHEADSIRYEMKYFPQTCDHYYTINMFVLLDGRYRQIKEIGYSFHSATWIILKGRVRNVRSNYNSKHP